VVYCAVPLESGTRHRLAVHSVLSLTFLVGLLSIIFLVSSSIVASADLHLYDLDDHCNLCHLTKEDPLFEVDLQAFIPPSYSSLWKLRTVRDSLHSDRIIRSGLCRAPPFHLPILLNQTLEE
jgi:hypothetical protein